MPPFFHQKEDRCDSHIWITVLPYHLLHWIEYSLRLSGYDANWRKAHRLLATHCYATIVIPSSDGLMRRIRKPGRPDERQRLTYDLLGIDWKSLPVHKKSFAVRCKKSVAPADHLSRWLSTCQFFSAKDGLVINRVV